MITLIEATTSAVGTGSGSNKSFKVGDLVMEGHHGIPVGLSQDGLAGSEEAEIKILSGSTYVAAVDQDGVALKFTATVTWIPMWVPGQYIVDKPSTASAVGFYLHTQRNP